VPIFKIPPVGPDDGGDIHEVVREIVGNRNYSHQERFGEGHGPPPDDLPRRGFGIKARLRKLFRR